MSSRILFDPFESFQKLFDEIALAGVVGRTEDSLLLLLCFTRRRVSGLLRVYLIKKMFTPMEEALDSDNINGASVCDANF